MEIYAFDDGGVTNIIYALGAILFAVVLGGAIKTLVQQIRAYKKSNLKFPVSLAVLFVLFVLVPLIGTLGLGNLCIEGMVYRHNMQNGNALLLTGDVKLVACDEEYYRGTFSGYTVSLEVDGVTISPANTFSKEVVSYFKSEQILTIQYAVIDGDGLYVWSIKIES